MAMSDNLEQPHALKSVPTETTATSPAMSTPETQLKTTPASDPALGSASSAARDLHDMIHTCDLLPSEDTTDRLLDICLALNQRINGLELELRKRPNEV